MTALGPAGSETPKIGGRCDRTMPHGGECGFERRCPYHDAPLAETPKPGPAGRLAEALKLFIFGVHYRNVTEDEEKRVDQAAAALDARLEGMEERCGGSSDGLSAASAGTTGKNSQQDNRSSSTSAPDAATSTHHDPLSAIVAEVVRRKRQDGWATSIMDALEQVASEVATRVRALGEEERLTRQRDALREALRQYGRHSNMCAEARGFPPCDCGYNVALRPSGKGEGEGET